MKSPERTLAKVAAVLALGLGISACAPGVHNPDRVSASTPAPEASPEPSYETIADPHELLTAVGSGLIHLSGELFPQDVTSDSANHKLSLRLRADDGSLVEMTMTSPTSTASELDPAATDSIDMAVTKGGKTTTEISAQLTDGGVIDTYWTNGADTLASVDGLPDGSIAPGADPVYGSEIQASTLTKAVALTKMHPGGPLPDLSAPHPRG